MPADSVARVDGDRWRATLWYLVAIMAGAAMTLLIRLASADIHPLEVSFFRSLFGALILLPVALARRLPLPPRAELRIHLGRALLVAGAMLSGFWALNLISVLETNVLGGSAPLFAAAGAVIFLKESVGRARWFALGLGFSGVLVTMGPGFAEFGWGAALALASAIFSAGSWLVLKVLTRRAPAWALVTILTFLMTPLTLIPALFIWRTPSAETLLWLALLALSATAGQYAATRAFALADVSFLASFQFLDLVTAAALGWFVFAEPVTAWALTGGILVVASVVYLARHEARAPRPRAATPTG